VPLCPAIFAGLTFCGNALSRGLETVVKLNFSAFFGILGAFEAGAWSLWRYRRCEGLRWCQGVGWYIAMGA